ncbi:MAG: helix-turn-helix domain-containing protein [Actinomycetota bacterium]|nr:helix-turn-helix domain-containing protein [Actinomycetota bacterium]
MARQDEMGTRVRDLRRKRALSLRGLAEIAEVSLDALQRIEAYPEGGSPRPSTIRKVAKALGVEPEYLTEGEQGEGEGASGRVRASEGARAQEIVLAFAARGRADAEGRDALEVYRELRENPPSLEDILGGELPADVAEWRARQANSYLVGLDPRRKERVPEGEPPGSDEVSEQRAGHLRA